MFNKKPRRNFRQRKDSSSDDEEQQKNSGEGDKTEDASAVINKSLKAAQGRGISCSSKWETTPPKADSSGEEEGEPLEVTEERDEKDKDGTKTKKSSILSFSDKEGNVVNCMEEP